MQAVMSDEEMVAAARLDSYAKLRAGLLGERAVAYSEAVVEVMRLFVCELAFQLYVPFADKFKVGNIGSLRELLNECWKSVRTGEQLPKAEVIKNKIDSAEFNDADWDHPFASDAVSSLCIIDACLSPATAGLVSLSHGIELLLDHSIKKMIDGCAELGGNLSELADEIESGSVLLEDEALLVEVLDHVRYFENARLFADWLLKHKAIDARATEN